MNDATNTETASIDLQSHRASPEVKAIAIAIVTDLGHAGLLTGLGFVRSSRAAQDAALSLISDRFQAAGLTCRSINLKARVYAGHAITPALKAALAERDAQH